MIKRPEWLNKKVHLKKCAELHNFLKSMDLNTVCREAMCPNISECSSQGIATFLILGKTCTRNCAFCAVSKGRPLAPDPQEPLNVAAAVKEMGLRHVVVTSVTRDDIQDGGASVFAETIKEIRKICADITIEVLVPDFLGIPSSIRKVVDAGPDIFAHNLETVPRLYTAARQMADYARSLDVIASAKGLNGGIKTKSGIMLGLGEREGEVMDLLADLRGVQCDFMSIGQYLAPSLKHYKVTEYVHPDRFEFYKAQAIALGFMHVESAPYVRSSYMASKYTVKKEGAACR